MGFVAVLFGGLFRGLLLEGVSGRSSLRDEYGSAVAGRAISGRAGRGLLTGPDINEPLTVDVFDVPDSADRPVEDTPDAFEGTRAEAVCVVDKVE